MLTHFTHCGPVAGRIAGADHDPGNFAETGARAGSFDGQPARRYPPRLVYTGAGGHGRFPATGAAPQGGPESDQAAGGAR